LHFGAQRVEWEQFGRSIGLNEICKSLEEHLMSVKVFVGNLPFSTDDNKLKEAFIRFGNVESARVVTDKHTGRSRGYGFVEFGDQTSAESSITGMNGQNYEGRPLTVSLAKSQGTGNNQNSQMAAE